MNKKELREYAKRFVEENFQFNKGDVVRIVVDEDSQEFGDAIKLCCEKKGAKKVIIEVSETAKAAVVAELIEETPAEAPAETVDTPVEVVETPVEVPARVEEPVAEVEETPAEIVEEVVAEEPAETTEEVVEEPVKPKSEVLLEVKDLKKYFVVGKNFFGKPTAHLKAVDNVSFTLKRGKTLGIVGESGCGKTTMGRTILRLYDVTGGEVYFNGKEVSKISEKAFNKLRPNMQMIFQDPYASLSPRLTVGEIIGEAARQHGLVDKANFRQYVLDVMKTCGLQPHYFDRYPHEFSGGQRQRICIARALALKPELVICDEPVSALDVSIQAQIINMLRELQQQLGLTYVFISHDLSVVKHISDEVGVMYLGSMVEYGSKERIFNNTLHPYTKALFSAVPVPNPHVKMNRVILKGDIPSPVNPPKGCKFHTRCDQCMEICKSVTPKYKEVEEGHFCSCHLYASEEEQEEMLAAQSKKKSKKK